MSSPIRKWQIRNKDTIDIHMMSKQLKIDRSQSKRSGCKILNEKKKKEEVTKYVSILVFIKERNVRN